MHCMMQDIATCLMMRCSTRTRFGQGITRTTLQLTPFCQQLLLTYSLQSMTDGSASLYTDISNSVREEYRHLSPFVNGRRLLVLDGDTSPADKINKVSDWVWEVLFQNPEVWSFSTFWDGMGWDGMVPSRFAT